MGVKVIAEHLSVEEVADIKDMFSKMDVNNNCKITLEELKFGLHKLGHQIADVKILMDAVDVDGNGTLDYREFIAVSVCIRKIGNDDHLHKAFAYFDQNKNGYIEIKELLQSLSDNGGKISYEELAAMMKASTDWGKASRQYSRERFNSLSLKLMMDGSLQIKNEQSR